MIKSLLHYDDVIFPVNNIDLLHDGADELLGVLPRGAVQGEGVMVLLSISPHPGNIMGNEIKL